jgi:CheY-like chemotaxis protein
MNPGKKVLVVDDEPGLRMTIGANLELEGFEVVEAASGAHALELIAKQPFDLVLSDIRMPGMNGVELFRRIRTLRPEMPVVLMTAFALEGLVQDALREGAFTVLPKPFAIDHLVRAISSAARSPIVLVVDDAEQVADSTATALAAMGMRARAVYDGESAIEVARGGEVDVCVVDMIMPGMNGPTVIQKIRALDPGIVFVAISGHEVRELFRKASLTVEAFLRKPVDPGDLMQAIAKGRGRP